MSSTKLIVDLANECWASRCLHAAVTLRIPDAVGEAPSTVEEVSRLVSADPRFVGAIISVLSDRGIFALKGGQVFHTSASAMLRVDHPSSLSPIVEWIGSEESWASFGQLPNAARLGSSGFHLYKGERLFEYLARHSQRMRAFSYSMEAFTKREIERILAFIDVSPYRTIVDVGAGTGSLAKEIAKRYPSANVVAFDLPGVDVPEQMPNLQVMSGDFFRDALPASDLAILMNVLHDWSDDDATRIVGAVCASLEQDGHVCIIEGVIDHSNMKTNMVNLGMLVMTEGMQRRVDEYRKMLSEFDFELFCAVKCSEYSTVLMARRAQQ